MFEVAKQHEALKSEILNAWQYCLETSQLTSGEHTVQFERAFAEFIHTKYAVAVRSGTASLIIALKAAGVAVGDEVITTPATFTATADAIVLVGATPVFVDVEPKYFTIDTTKIEEKITSKTKAILAVHLYGVPCKLDSLVNICQKFNLKLIEDCSHAHGSLYRGKPVGSFGLAGCFSLYPSKTLGAAGNAGIITSNDQQFIERARMYAHHGIIPGKSKYEHYLSGYNELIDNVQAAVLLIKMEHLTEWIKKKKEIVNFYNTEFKHLGLQMSWPQYTDPSFYVYSLQVKNRDDFQKRMVDHGVETGVYYPIALHLQPTFNYLKYKKGEFPVTEKWADETLSLPCHPFITQSELSMISDLLRELIGLV